MGHKCDHSVLVERDWALRRADGRYDLGIRAIGLGARSSELPILHTIYDMSKEFQKTGVSGLVIKTGLDPLNSRTWNAHEWDKQ